MSKTAIARILIVEDERIIAKAMEHDLRRLGYEVTAIAASGEKAIELAERDRPDLVLMDIKLEGSIDGIETAYRLRSSFNMPVVIISAYSDQANLERAKLAQPYGFLIKPYNTRELHSTISIALHKSLMDRRLKELHDELERRVEDRTADLNAAYEKIRKTSTLLAEAERIAHVGAWRWDAVTNEAFWSDEVYRIFGISPNEFGAWCQTFLELVHPDDLESVKKSVNDALKDGKPFSIEHRIVLPDGRVRFVNERAEVKFDKLGQPVEITGFAQDITEHREARDRLELTVNELTRRMKQLTALGHQTRELSRFMKPDHLVSLTHKHLFDTIAPDEVIVYLLEEKGLIVQGKEPSISDFPEVHKMGECLCGLAASEGKPVYSADIHSDPRCTLKECKNAGLHSLCAIPLIVEDTTIGVLAVGSLKERDFSKELVFLEAIAGQLAIGFYNAKLFEQLQEFQRELENRVKDRTNRLDQANKTLGKKIAELKKAEELQAQLIEEIKYFAYIVSHDLHAPLVNLKGFLDELKGALDVVFPVVEHAIPSMKDTERTQLVHLLSEDIPESLDFMESSIARMDRLIQAVMQVSRVGRRELVFEPLDMNELVRKIIDSLSHLIVASDTKVMVGTLPVTIADRTAMEQVMGNLISNALKFIDPRRIAEIEITGHHFPDENVFVVRDTGRGISESERSRIFQMFHRSENENIPGEGMGLAHVKTLVLRHGGRIWCESEPGKGATFTFTISNRLPEHQATSGALATPPESDSIRK